MMMMTPKLKVTIDVASVQPEDAMNVLRRISRSRNHTAMKPVTAEAAVPHANAGPNPAGMPPSFTILRPL